MNHGNLIADKKNVMSTKRLSHWTNTLPVNAQNKHTK